MRISKVTCVILALWAGGNTEGLQAAGEALVDSKVRTSSDMASPIFAGSICGGIASAPPAQLGVGPGTGGLQNTYVSQEEYVKTIAAISSEVKALADALSWYVELCAWITGMCTTFLVIVLGFGTYFNYREYAGAKALRVQVEQDERDLSQHRTQLWERQEKMLGEFNAACKKSLDAGTLRIQMEYQRLIDRCERRVYYYDLVQYLKDPKANGKLIFQAVSQVYARPEKGFEPLFAKAQHAIGVCEIDKASKERLVEMIAYALKILEAQG
jgi:hypothetical protein